MTRKPRNSEIGEGNYRAARTFQREQHAFAKSGAVAAKGREAARAMTGPGAAELEHARQVSAQGQAT